MTSTKVFCPECELRALQSQLDAKSIAEEADKMAFVPGVSTEPEEYRKRLDVCASCPSLRAGILCAECGSYVAFRAKIRNAVCPYIGQNKWSNI